MLRSLICFILLFFGAESLASATLGLEVGTYPLVGFYFASRPEQMFGWYGDLKGSLPFIDDKNIYKFNSTYAETVLNDRYVKTVRTLGYFDLGATKTITEWLDGFAALGLGSQTKYRNYLDRFGILGEGGKYYIQTNNSLLFNAQIGLLFYLNRLSIKLSYDSGAPSFNFGLGFVF